MNVEHALALLGGACQVTELEVYRRPIDEHFVVLPRACIHQAVSALVGEGDVIHLSTITGQDLDGEIELLYHFWSGSGLTLRTALPRTEARIATITDLIPGAAFYEREIGEMLQVTFEGHPGPEGLLLPDDWEGGPPLRQEFSLSREEDEP